MLFIIRNNTVWESAILFSFDLCLFAGKQGDINVVEYKLWMCVLYPKRNDPNQKLMNN